MTGRTATGEREAWIGLASTPGVGDVTFERLLAAWGDARRRSRPWPACPARADEELAGTLGLRRRTGLAAAIRVAAADPGRPERAMKALGGWVLTPLDSA